MIEIFNDACDTFPKKLTDKLYLLGNYYFNLYLAKGEKKTALMEVGVSAVIDSVIEQLESLDVEPDYLVMMHPHSDHITGLSGLQERYPDARVVAGKGAYEFITHPKAAGAILYEDRFMTEESRIRGLSPGRPPLNAPPSLGDFDIAYNGDTIDLSGVTLEFMALKGHAPGNLGIRMPEIDALHVSDSLGFNYPQRGFHPLFFTGFHDYMASIDKVMEIAPDILCLAHQGPLFGSDAANAIQQARQAAAGMLDKIAENRNDREAISEEIFRECYRDEFSMYSEKNIKSSCDLLVRRGIEAIEESEKNRGS